MTEIEGRLPEVRTKDPSILPSPCSGEPVARPERSGGAVILNGVHTRGPGFVGPDNELRRTKQILITTFMSSAPQRTHDTASMSRARSGAGRKGAVERGKSPPPDIDCAAGPQSTIGHPRSLPAPRYPVNSQRRYPAEPELPSVTRFTTTRGSAPQGRGHGPVCQTASCAGSSPVDPDPPLPISTRTNRRFPR